METLICFGRLINGSLSDSFEQSIRSSNKGSPFKNSADIFFEFCHSSSCLPSRAREMFTSLHLRSIMRFFFLACLIYLSPSFHVAVSNLKSAPRTRRSFSFQLRFPNPLALLCPETLLLPPDSAASHSFFLLHDQENRKTQDARKRSRDVKHWFTRSS